MIGLEKEIWSACIIRRGVKRNSFRRGGCAGIDCGLGGSVFRQAQFVFGRKVE